jgi:crotonobetaine/carnitine-CoA ligase
VRIAWGGGCPRAAWKPFEERFGVGVRECYGMTEASSFTTISREPRFGSVGKPLPYFDVRATDDSGREVGADISGEIRVRAKTTGLITAGYFRNPEATAAALVDGWLRTGDVGRRDEDGFFYYAGRLKDALRRRGENISAWEIERVFAEHPAVAECAVIGVDDPISEQEVKIIIKLNEKHDIKEMDLLKWSESRLPRFQIPRYVAFIDVFPKTPTERIRKELLSRDVSNDFDREKIRTRSSKHASRAAPPHSRRDDS